MTRKLEDSPGLVSLFTPKETEAQQLLGDLLELPRHGRGSQRWNPFLMVSETL